MSARVISIKPSTKKEEETSEPLEEYKAEVSRGTLDKLPYDRLMIYYRKNKEYNKELQVVKKAIATLKKYYADLQRTTINKKINPKIKSLSSKIGKSMGLLDKKGNHIYLPDPLPRWIKRQSVVEEKIKKEKKGKK